MTTSRAHDDHLDPRSAATGAAAAAAGHGAPATAAAQPDHAGPGADGGDATGNPETATAAAGRAGLDGPDAGYEVGYGKPPQHTRFKPGVSGNPKGRKKNSKSLKTILETALDEKVEVRTGRGTTRMSKLEVMVQTQINAAIKGNTKSFNEIIDLAIKAGLTEDIQEALNASRMQPLSDADDAIMRQFANGVALLGG